MIEGISLLSRHNRYRHCPWRMRTLATATDWRWWQGLLCMELHSGVWKFRRAQFSSCIVRRSVGTWKQVVDRFQNCNSFVWYL